LVVGVDRDETVCLKGEGRPVIDLGSRCEMLAALNCVDLVFPIPFVLRSYSSTKENSVLFEKLTRQIRPTILVANEITDQFWQEKKRRAETLGVHYVGLRVERPISSTEIGKKIQRL
jgi:bifunctional ADP-heptose synthase (sugar kinase/adenylyltransferase)